LLRVLLLKFLVARQYGPMLYTNLLFALILPFREWLARFALFGPDGTNLAGQIVSSGAVAILFPAALVMFRSEKTAVRVLSVGLLALLILMALWWGRFPNI
jgi:hypothetical protein